MRKQLVIWFVPSLLALCACEDGPSQVFQPSPAGAGTVWGANGGGGYAEDAGKDFNNVSGSKNANELCTPIEKHAKWSWMVNQPIFPPALGGINILGSSDPNDATKTNFAGLTIDQAEKILCQSTPIGAEYTDNNPYNSWGDNGEVTLGYLQSNRRAVQIEVHAGYHGRMTFHSRDGKDTFTFSADNEVVMKNGQPYNLDWKNLGTPTTPGSITHEINELYDAMTNEFSTFAHEDNCISTGHCGIADFNDGGAYLNFRILGILIRVSSTVADIATASKPERIIIRPVKILGYSQANVTMKLDAEGPKAYDPAALGTDKKCTVAMGTKFSDFRNNCVTVWPDTAFMADNKTKKNDVEMAKLYGGISHNDERFSFSVSGLNSDFTDLALSPTDIIRDNDRPTDNDIATTFVVTGGTLGKIANDYVDNDVTKAKDGHGVGLVLLEMANLAQTVLQNMKYPNPTDPLRKVIGDPRCLVADPSTVDGCTGLEGIVTSAPAAAIPSGSPMAVNAIGMMASKFASLPVSMKPATWRTYYCNDAGGIDGTGALKGYKSCVGGGGFDSFFKTSYNQVVKVFGKGVETNLPAEVRDVRFIFKQFVFAMIKYLQVAAKVTPTATLAEVDAGVIDPDNLFFDSIGTGQYEFAEYVDRHLVNSAGQDPTDMLISADTLNGIMSDYEFSRDLYRGETAVYDALLQDRANNKVGAENTLLMNIVGNAIIPTLYSDVDTTYTGYKCATENIPNAAGVGPLDAQCNNQQAFTQGGVVVYNEAGKPVLTNYPGAFAGKQTPFAIANKTPIAIKQTFPLIRSAQITVPLHQNPFDPTSAALAPHQTLVPWVSKNNGGGFYVAVNGTQDKYVNTNELDFSGTTISLGMDFIYPPNPATHNDDPGACAAALGPKDDPSKCWPKVAAAETTDFLGEFWMCQDANTGDVLRVRMYTSAQTILDWFSNHPGTNEACDVVYRYGPFGNYLDYITARANGVRVGINPGAGSGRVIDITVYDPAYN